MFLKKTIQTLLFITMLISSCQKNLEILDSDPDNKQRVELDYSIRDSIKEATEFALWLSGELEAPDSLVNELLYNLNYLRNKFGNTYPIVKYSRCFLPPWKVGQISCKVDSQTARLINNNIYTGWEILPLSLQPDTIIRYPGNLGWCTIGFDEMYHPNRLSEIYSTLSGFIICEPSGRMFSGLSGYPFFPGISNGKLSYLYPDMPDGPNNYYYFKYEGEEPIFIGKWDIINESEPDWWSEAKKNIENFGEWDGYG